MQLDKNTFKKLCLLVGGAIAFYWCLQNLALLGKGASAGWNLVFPFLLGFVVAYILNIPMRALEKTIFKGKKTKMARLVSFCITVILLVVVLGLVLFLVVPQLASTIVVLGKALPGYYNQVEKLVLPYSEYLPQLQKWLEQADINWSEVGKKIFSSVGSGAGDIFNSAVGATMSVVSGVASFSIAFIFACYLLFDKERFCAQFDGLLKAYLPSQWYTRLYNFGMLTDRIFSKFVAGQCTEAVAISIVFLVVLSVFRFEYALLISVLIGFMSLIPVFGAFIGCAVGAFLIFVAQGWFHAAMFIVVFLVIQQLDGNFMYPKIVGNSVGLPPIWVMVAVILGGGLFGFAGMLFFIPLSSVLYTLLVKDTLKRLSKKGIAVPKAAQYDAEREKRPKEKTKKK